MTTSQENVTSKDSEVENEEQLSLIGQGHTGLKILVVLMGVAILVMIFLISMKIMDLLSGDKPADKPVAEQQVVETVKQPAMPVVTESSTETISETAFMQAKKPQGGIFRTASHTPTSLMIVYEMPNGSTVIQVISLEKNKVTNQITVD